MAYSISRTEAGVTRYPLHTHTHYEVMYYLTGDGILESEAGPLPFSPGCMVIMPPGVQHGSAAAGGFINISVGGDFSHLLQTKTPCLLYDSAAGDGRLLAEAIYRNRYGNEAYLSALCRAYACFLSASVQPPKGVAHAVQTIITALEDGCADPETDATAILLQSGYAEDYIRAHFRAMTGLTPTAYLTRARLDRARNLLDIYGHSLSVLELAERCGFDDPIYFSKRFKQQFGKSPTKI